MTDEEFKFKVLEALTRLEPVCDDVKALKKWRDGNGLPGARFQLWLLWAVFAGVVAKVWARI